MLLIVFTCYQLHNNDKFCKCSPLSIVVLRSSLPIFIDSWQQEGEEDKGEGEVATSTQIELREP